MNKVAASAVLPRINSRFHGVQSPNLNCAGAPEGTRTNAPPMPPQLIPSSLTAPQCRVKHETEIRNAEPIQAQRLRCGLQLFDKNESLQIRVSPVWFHESRRSVPRPPGV